MAASPTTVLPEPVGAARTTFWASARASRALRWKPSRTWGKAAATKSARALGEVTAPSAKMRRRRGTAAGVPAAAAREGWAVEGEGWVEEMEAEARRGEKKTRDVGKAHGTGREVRRV